MTHINAVQNTPIGLSKILHIMNMGRGRITVPVKGVGTAGINLQHIQGQKAFDDNGVSLARIVAINSLLNSLTGTQKAYLKTLFDDMTQGKRTKNEFFDALRKIAVDTNKGSMGQSSVSNGLVVNVLV